MKSTLPLLVLVATSATAGAEDPLNIVTVAGTIDLGDTRQTLTLLAPTGAGIAFDRLGNLYLSELSAQRIRQIAPDGSVKTIAGTGITGKPLTQNTIAEQTQLNSPHGLSIEFKDDGSPKYIYFGDAQNQRVRRIDFSGSGKPTIADVRANVANPLSTVFEVAPDGTRNLYVGDFNGNTVLQLDPDTGALKRTFLGNPRFAGPNGLALWRAPDGKRLLYVAERMANQVQRIDLDSGTAEVVIPSTTPATVVAPTGVALDSSGNLYIGERGGGAPGGVPDKGHRIFKLENGQLKLFAGDAAGEGGYGGDGLSPLEARMSQPVGLAFPLRRDGALDESALYVNELSGHRIRKIDMVNGTISTFAGTGLGCRPPMPPCPATSVAVRKAASMAFDAAGNLYVAEVIGARVRRIDPIERTITDVAGTGVPGYVPNDNGNTAGPFAKIRDPGALAFDGLTSRLYIGERDGVQQVPSRVRYLQLDTGTIGLLLDGLPAVPAGLAVDGSGRVYLSEMAGRIRQVGGWGPFNFAASRGLAWSADVLYAILGNEIHKLNPATGLDLGLVAAGFNAPSDLDASLYVADSGNQQVRRVDGTVVAGNGQAGYAGEGGLATNAQLANPTSVRLDAAGNIYVSEQDAHRVRRLQIAATVGLSRVDTGYLGAQISFANHDPGEIDPSTITIQPIDPATQAPGTLSKTVGSFVVPAPRVVSYPTALRVEGRLISGRYFSSDVPVASACALDTEAPVASFDPVDNQRWYTGDVLVPFSVTDNCAATSISTTAGCVIDGASLRLTGEGETVRCSLQVADAAGNTATFDTPPFAIDRTPPVASLSLDPAVVWPPDHRPVTITGTLTLSDALSGAGAITSLELMGQALTIPAPGSSFTFTIRADRGTLTVHYAARDEAGNTVAGDAAVVVPHDRR